MATPCSSTSESGTVYVLAEDPTAWATEVQGQQRYSLFTPSHEWQEAAVPETLSSLDGYAYGFQALNPGDVDVQGMLVAAFSTERFSPPIAEGQADISTLDEEAFDRWIKRKSGASDAFQVERQPVRIRAKKDLLTMKSMQVKGWALALFLTGLAAGQGQIEVETRKSMTLELRPVMAPPQLELDAADFRFVDDNGNGILDANETGQPGLQGHQCSHSDGGRGGLELRGEPGWDDSGGDGAGGDSLGGHPHWHHHGVHRAAHHRHANAGWGAGIGPEGSGALSRWAACEDHQAPNQAYRKPELRVVDHRIKEGEIKRGQVFTYQFLMRNKGRDMLTVSGRN